MDSCCFNSLKLFKKWNCKFNIISNKHDAHQVGNQKSYDLGEFILWNVTGLLDFLTLLLDPGMVSSQGLLRFCEMKAPCPKPKTELGLKRLSLYRWPCLSLHSTTQHPAKDPINTNTGCSFSLECSRAASQSSISSSCGLLVAQDLGHLQWGSRTA